MKLAEIIETLGQAGAGEFPQAALEQARAVWSEFLPHLDQLMEKFCAGESLSEAEDNCLFFGVILLADRVEVSRFEKLVQLCNGSDEFGSPLDQLLGDLITSMLPSIFYVLAEGRSKPLIELAQSPKAGEYIKNAAIEVLFAQLETGQLDRGDVIAVIPDIIDAQVQHPFAFAELAQHLIWYGFDAFQARLIELYDANKIDNWDLPRKDIQQWMNHPSFEPGWQSGQVQAQVDVMELKNWAAFNPSNTPKSQAQPEITAQDIEAMKASFYGEQPYIAPEKIGRNDPCPCGSGKKYKKCCMN